MSAGNTALVVQTTTGSYEEASALASSLVSRRVAACVQIIPGVESHYWWDGKATKSEECLLLCKTSRDAYPELERAILELHSYDTPEIVALPVERGSERYLSWLASELGPADQ